MVNDMEEDDRGTRDLITTGSDIAGAAVGGALGFLAGGPGAAAAAAAGGVALSRIANNLLSDWANRRLSYREEVRVGAAAAFALEVISSYLEDGNDVRQDGFFHEGDLGRSSAEEIFDGVLQKSKNEHEEKKIKYLGILYANIAFIPNISIGESNLLVHLIGELTYRQLCLISFFSRREEQGVTTLRAENYHQVPDGFTFETFTLLQEIFQLSNRGLIAHSPSGTQGYIVLLGWSSVVPDQMVVTPFGERLSVLAGLSEIPWEELEGLARQIE